MSEQKIPSVLEDVSWQMGTNYMGFAAFTMLVWDHMDTFADEVNYIWFGTKGPIVYLFLLNRYLTPLGFMVNLYAYLSPMWTPEVRAFPTLQCRAWTYISSSCDRFIRFEGAMTVTGINVVAIMMFLRIYALYNQNRPILVGVLILLIIEFSVNAYLLTHGERVHHNPDSGVVACTMIFSPKVPGWLAASSAWLPLIYDTVILGLTINRTLPSLKNRRTSYIMTRLFQDGLVYYSAIFAVTLVLTLMIVSAPPGIQNITAQLELLLTVAMMSRITINLKKSVNKAKDISVRPELPSMFTQKSTMEPEPGMQIVTPGFNSGKKGKIRAGPMDTMMSDDESSYDPTTSYPLMNFSKRLSTIAEASMHRASTTVQNQSGGMIKSFVDLDTADDRKRGRADPAKVRNLGRW
ncbi:hypothetical protein BKA70DRAFT_1422412 [Coprinopsis sp. MPI-PUGE-AT-0042]|nr:hypothetical protein BKA70DRAFT_1422412 [Coprinopsis sp. MPI-PUGE-AT-0042]